MNIEQPKDLKAYLLNQGHLEPGEPFDMQVLAGGVSNRTVLLKTNTKQWVLKQALEKLRVAVDWFSSPERIHREAAGMHYLHELAPENITRLIFEDDDEHILAMEAVPQPHQNWKVMLLGGDIQATHVEQFATLLATIHKGAYLSQTKTQHLFKERVYFENLRLEPYYLYTAEQITDAKGFLERLVNDTRERLITLVHGDYSPKNVLVYNNKLVLLDHEVIHFGDPAFDIGFGMTHLLSKAHHLEAQREAFLNAARLFWTVYQAGARKLDFARDLEPFAVKHTLACLLARVRGRSPLEYLGKAERSLQEKLVLELMQQKIIQVPKLVSAFAEGVQHVSH